MAEPDRQTVDIGALFEDDTAIAEALRRGARDVRRLHKGLGLPLYEWRDGEVVTIQPEDVVIDARSEDSEPDA